MLYFHRVACSVHALFSQGGMFCSCSIFMGWRVLFVLYFHGVACSVRALFSQGGMFCPCSIFTEFFFKNALFSWGGMCNFNRVACSVHALFSQNSSLKMLYFHGVACSVRALFSWGGMFCSCSVFTGWHVLFMLYFHRVACSVRTLFSQGGIHVHRIILCFAELKMLCCRVSIYPIICLKSVDVRRLQVVILALPPREMSQTDCILPRYILSRVCISVRPRIFLYAKNRKPQSPAYFDPRCGDKQRNWKPQNRGNSVV